MKNKAISSPRPPAPALLMQWVLTQFRSRRPPAPVPVAPHDSTLHDARSIPRHLGWTQVTGWTLVTLLLGGLTLAAFVLRQDISLMITLHQLRSMYGTTNIYRIEYGDDGWNDVVKIEPYELIYQTRGEEESAFPAEGTASSRYRATRLPRG